MWAIISREHLHSFLSSEGTKPFLYFPIEKTSDTIILFFFKNNNQALYLSPPAKATHFENEVQYQHYPLMWIVILELCR